MRFVACRQFIMIAPGKAGLAPSDALIRFDRVAKSYSTRDGVDVSALSGIDLSVAAGSVLGVIGRSGAGKSSLIRLINGLERPSAGTIKVGDAEVSSLDERALRQVRRRIGMIFQHFNLLSSRTVSGNIALPLEIEGRGRAAIRARVGELLALTGLEDQRDRYPAELSGGQKQRVGIARALATGPSVLSLRRGHLRPRSRDHAVDPGAAAPDQSRTRPHHRAHHP